MIKKIIAITAAIMTLSTNLLASDRNDDKGDWSLMIGAAGVTLPEYVGSDSKEVVGIPLIKAHKQFTPNHSIYFNIKEGGYKYSFNKHFHAGLRTAYRRGRDTDKDVFLNGMTTVEDTMESGLFIQAVYNTLSIDISALKGGDDTNEGTAVRVKIAYDQRFDKVWKVGLSASILHGDDDYMENYFTVKASEATATRAEFSADSGISEIQATATISRIFNKKHVLMTGVIVSSLREDAADSSLTQDDKYIIGFAGYGYRF